MNFAEVNSLKVQQSNYLKGFYIFLVVKFFDMVKCTFLHLLYNDLINVNEFNRKFMILEKILELTYYFLMEGLTNFNLENIPIYIIC